MQQLVQVEVDAPDAELPGLDLREIEQVADQFGQRTGAFDDVLEIPAQPGRGDGLVEG